MLTGCAGGDCQKVSITADFGDLWQRDVGGGLLEFGGRDAEWLWLDLSHSPLVLETRRMHPSPAEMLQQKLVKMLD